MVKWMNDRTKASRRKLITFAAALASARSWIMKAQTPLKPDSRPLNADQALRELLAGNHRFLTGNRISPRGRPEEFRALTHGQFPEAVIVCCADSRVAPEIPFDVGVGDIFVVRVAGNVIDSAGVTVKGSIEYSNAVYKGDSRSKDGHAGFTFRGAQSGPIVTPRGSLEVLLIGHNCRS
jgi:carbonic anhydrase